MTWGSAYGSDGEELAQFYNRQTGESCEVLRKEEIAIGNVEDTLPAGWLMLKKEWDGGKFGAKGNRRYAPNSKRTSSCYNWAIFPIGGQGVTNFTKGVQKG